MAWDQQHKKQTRSRILASAAKLFTRYGFDNVAIDQVMQDAGLTRGAFYAHFKTKSELYAKAIVTGAITASSQHSSEASVEDIVAGYLHINHLNNSDQQCPLAFLTTDISQRDEQVRHAYTKVFQGLINRLQTGGLARQDAVTQTVLMVGGIAISRALDDEQLINELLHSCQQHQKQKQKLPQ